MFFDDLTAEEIARVESIGVVRRYQKGDFVIDEGVPGTSFFLVLSGSLEVRKNLGSGKHKKLVDLTSCDLIGEVCFLGVIFRSASVVAQSNASLLEFERDAFEELVKNEPVIGLKVYRGMARELAQRLARSDDEIKDTVLWALNEAGRGPISSDGPRSKPRLLLASLQAFDPAI